MYARVSTQYQAKEGVSLDVQERSLVNAAQRLGYKSYEVLREEGKSAKSSSSQTVLKEALERLALGEAAALISTRMDRLARSTQDFLEILDHSNEYGWELVLLDINVDMASYQGRFMGTIMSAIAEMEYSIIGERQKDIHKDRREQGLVWGKDLGPKKRVSEDTVSFIVQKKQEGVSLHGIARELNAKGIPTGYGENWTASTIKYVLERNT